MGDAPASAAEVAELRARLRKHRRRENPDLDYLFVVTYGRSGSTLVSGLLNAIPGYLIRGENRDALHHLFTFHRTMLTESRRGSKERLRQPTHPFFGIADFPAQRSLAGIRRLVVDTVLRPEEDTRVTGFKEIRWYHPDLEEYVAWLREVFPGARFLVNTRAHADVLQSKWWAQGDEDERARKAEHLEENEERLLRLAADLGDAAYHVHYDEYVADPAVLRGMYEWLGEPWDEESVRATMAVRHSV
ncbi:sulfotransferase [Nocardioides sp. SOB77]|uniref:Sulfotransferase n=1 Tax=Nocardioides oceani TaxID=3058369 RepID=A0ABT8FEY3_9ACTN|nr:sulfotransferase [Nocardioides oceani]MDN4173226.1 sulfotransferase [Nocardioides oceani]